MPGEPVAAEEQGIAPGDGEWGDHRAALPSSDRAGQRVAELGVRCGGGRRHDAEIDQLLGHRLVAGALEQVAVAEQVAAAVPYVKEIGSGPGPEVERERRGHAAIRGVTLALPEQLCMA